MDEKTLLDYDKKKWRETTTIRIGVDFKKELDKIKIHSRETYEDIIRRLMKGSE